MAVWDMVQALLIASVAIPMWKSTLEVFRLNRQITAASKYYTDEKILDLEKYIDVKGLPPNVRNWYGKLGRGLSKLSVEWLTKYVLGISVVGMLLTLSLAYLTFTGGTITVGFYTTVSIFVIAYFAVVAMTKSVDFYEVHVVAPQAYQMSIEYLVTLHDIGYHTTMYNPEELAKQPIELQRYVASLQESKKALDTIIVDLPEIELKSATEE